MTIKETKNFVIEQVSIQQTPKSSIEKFFVDTHDGKNLKVFDSRREAIAWVQLNEGHNATR